MTQLVRTFTIVGLLLVALAVSVGFAINSLDEGRAVSNGPCADTTEPPCLRQATATLRRVDTQRNQTFWAADGYDRVRMDRSDALRLGLGETAADVELLSYGDQIIEVSRDGETFQAKGTGWSKFYLAAMVALGAFGLMVLALLDGRSPISRQRLLTLSLGWIVGLAVGPICVFAGLALTPAAIVGVVATVLGVAVAATYSTAQPKAA